jgi:hypothetical protein
MIVFPNQKLIYFAVPKTGTTAVEEVLGGRVAGAVVVEPARKHMNVRQFERTGNHILTGSDIRLFQRFAVLRDPLERLRSWYRYRRRLGPDNPKSTSGISFSVFVEALLSPDPPEYAQVGNQWSFATRKDGSVGIDHLFATENLSPFRVFLSERSGDLPDFPRRNSSQPADVTLDPGIEAQLRIARQSEFALYDQVLRSDGHLQAVQSPRSAGVS